MYTGTCVIALCKTVVCTLLEDALSCQLGRRKPPCCEPVESARKEGRLPTDAKPEYLLSLEDSKGLTAANNMSLEADPSPVNIR